MQNLITRSPIVPASLVLASLATACGFPRPADVPDISCTANEFIDCDGNVARTCNATGDDAVTKDCGAAGCNATAKRCNQCAPNTASCGASRSEIDRCGPDGLPAPDTCPLGCIAAPAPHCAYLEPRYLPNICDAVATMPSFIVENSATFDTTLDNNCNGGVITQESDPQICVVRYRSIDITHSGSLFVFGARALALVGDVTVEIDGVLDVSADVAASGPGGAAVRSGDAVSTNGGGGAGFATAGGAGGSVTMTGGGGLGGGKATDPSLVTVLLGGTAPARSPNGLGAPFAGGAGGGATLIACRGEVSVSGMIDAGGGGGGGGKVGNFAGSSFAGAGGGSGGYVVLQGLSITVTGQMFANGGGGGAGWVPGGMAGQPGGDGTRSATTAASGGAARSGEGSGGAGGRQGEPPGLGLQPSVTTSLPGGGGGSMGFFQTYTPRTITPTLTPSAASPAFSPNKTLNTR